MWRIVVAADVASGFASSFTLLLVANWSIRRRWQGYGLRAQENGFHKFPLGIMSQYILQVCVAASARVHCYSSSLLKQQTTRRTLQTTKQEGTAELAKQMQ